MIVNWASDLVVDSIRLVESMSFILNKPVRIKEGTCGISNSDWIYAHWPIDDQNVFRFAIHILTGKAVVLFIQTGDNWLTGLWENYLIGGLTIKIGRDGEEVPVDDDSFLLKMDKGFDYSDTIVCFGWFNEKDFRGYKTGYVNGLGKGYQELWNK